MRWHRAGSEPSASPAITSGSRANALSPEISASSRSSHEQRQRLVEPPGVAPAGASAGRDRADLRRAEGQPLRVEIFAERRRSPAGRRTSSARGPWPRTRRWRAPWRGRRLAAGMDDDIERAVVGLLFGESAAETGGDSALDRSGSTTTTSVPRMPAAIQVTRRPMTPAPTTATRSPGPIAASQTPFSAVSMLAARTALPAGKSAGSGLTWAAGTTKRS